jgi:hypothetical protein
LLREYVFQQRLTLNQLTAPDYLALAQSRLETPAAKPDVSGALELLHRMTMLPGDLYANLDSAAGLLVRSGHTAEALPYLKTLAASNPWQPAYRLRLARAQLAIGQDTQAAGATVTALAEGGNVPYRLREQAAVALRPLPGVHSLSSGELSLLASHSASPTQADHPYFAAAREFAASIAPVAMRPLLLRAAMAVEPDDALRVALFRAEFANGADERAIAVAQSLQANNSGYGYRRVRPESDRFDENEQPDDGYPIEGDATANGTEDPPIAGMPAVLRTRNERLEFALDLGTAQEHLGHDGEAVGWLVDAGQLTSDSARRKELASRIGADRERMRVREENDSRRPVVQPSLDQAVLVRPMLVAGAPGGLR